MGRLQELRARYSGPRKEEDGTAVFWTRKDLEQWVAKVLPLGHDGKQVVWGEKPTMRVHDGELVFGQFSGKKLSELAATGKGRGYLRWLYHSIAASPIQSLVRLALDEEDSVIREKYNRHETIAKD